MWKAMIIVCSITAPDKCETWVDAIGPSKSYEQCVERALQMSKDAFIHLRDYNGEIAWKGKRYQCNKLPGGML